VKNEINPSLKDLILFDGDDDEDSDAERFDIEEHNVRSKRKLSESMGMQICEDCGHRGVDVQWDEIKHKSYCDECYESLYREHGDHDAKLIREQVRKLLREADEAGHEEEEKLMPKEDDLSVDAEIDRFLTEYEKTAKKDDKFDVYEFAASVARMINNADELIDISNVILKRSLEFLKKAHNPEVIDAYIETMKNDYDTEADKSKIDKKYEITPPPAVGAGPDGGGP
jgi:ssDNA-binding Zn-finger/Zn-ribbon topoisomerase 1